MSISGSNENRINRIEAERRVVVEVRVLMLMWDVLRRPGTFSYEALGASFARTKTLVRARHDPQPLTAGATQPQPQIPWPS
jgi:hypothetical protein